MKTLPSVSTNSTANALVDTIPRENNSYPTQESVQNVHYSTFKKVRVCGNRYNNIAFFETEVQQRIVRIWLVYKGGFAPSQRTIRHWIVGGANPNHTNVQWFLIWYVNIVSCELSWLLFLFSFDDARTIFDIVLRPQWKATYASHTIYLTGTEIRMCDNPLERAAVFKYLVSIC